MTLAPVVKPETDGSHTRDEDVLCPQCGYDLRGTEDAGGARRCPECGLQVGGQGGRVTRIPWVYRRAIGRFAAYRRTARLATVSPARLAAEADGPVAYRDALRFRMLTCLLAAAPVAALILALMAWYGSAGFINVVPEEMLLALMQGGDRRAWTLAVLVPWEAGATFPPQLPLVLPAALFAAAVLVTGVASYAFHPRRLPVVRQNRAVALSHYACAPLAFLWVPVGAFMAMAVLQQMALADPGTGFPRLISLLAVVGCVGVAAVGFLFLRSTLVLYRRTTGASIAATVIQAVGFPVAWVVCSALAIVGMPWLVGLARLMVRSLL